MSRSRSNCFAPLKASTQAFLFYCLLSFLGALTSTGAVAATVSTKPARTGVEIRSVPIPKTREDHGVFYYSRPAATRLYADFQTGIQGVRHSDLNFYPAFASATLGFWMFDNIGLDFFADSGLTTDDEGIFELEITEATGVALRFQSPARVGQVHAYVILGYVNFQIEQTENDARGERRVIQNFSGTRLSVGFAKRLRSMTSVLLTGEYRNYYSDKDLQADTLAVGFQVNLQ